MESSVQLPHGDEAIDLQDALDLAEPNFRQSAIPSDAAEARDPRCSSQVW
jgi:hypothetical protein